MNENNFENKENDDQFYLSLKEENEDNLIKNLSVPKKVVEFKEEKMFNEISKYKLNYDGLLQYINQPDIIVLYDQFEYFCQLLLMPINISINNKISILYNLLNLYHKSKQNQLLIRIFLKLEKIIKNQNNIDIKYYMDTYSKIANVLFEDYKNYFYAYKYIKKCIAFINNPKNKISDGITVQITNSLSLISQKVFDYLAEKKAFFLDENNKEVIKKINDLTTSIIDDKNNKEIDESDENKKYLYVINRDWMYKLLEFIQPQIRYSYQEGKNNNKSDKNNFDLEYVFESYFENDTKGKVKEIAKEKEKEKTQIDYIFPGPINNFKITSFKDSWVDTENLDENDYIKKNSENYLVNYEDWNFLNSIFGNTNIIRRKKDNLDLVSFKFILFDSRIKVKKNNVNLLKERYIQVNKNIKIKQLKEKILRCVDNELKKSKSEKQICFFILDKDKIDILIEASFANVNNIPIYDSCFIKKIEYQDEDNMDNFFSFFDKNKQILLIEILKKDDMNYLCQIDKENIKCSICEKKLKDENDIYRCNICHYSIFCSNKCANNSDFHRLIDKKLKQILISKFDLSEILYSKNNNILNSGNQGRTNISINGEDESFFISSIHCISNTSALTKYFLTKSYKQEQKPGFDMYFTDYYYKLINALWEFGSRSISIEISYFCKRIGLTSCYNVEPYDFIFHLFEKFNEELNRASGDYKKEIDSQKKDESDEEACRRFKINSRRNKDSIITDLFVGQSKESIKCISCGTEYINFPDFFSLSIPFPDKKLNIQLKLLSKNLDFTYVNIKINDNTEMKDFLFKAIKHLKKDTYIKHLANRKTNEGVYNYNIKDVPESILYNSLLFIEVNKDFKIIKMHNTSYNNCPTDKNNKKNIYYNNNKISFDTMKYKKYKEENQDKKIVSELVIFEKGIFGNNPDYITCFVYPFALVDKETFFAGKKKSYKLLSYPVLLMPKKTDTIEDLKTIIFNKFKRALMNQFKNETNSIDLYYPHFSQSWESLKIKEAKCPICQKNYTKDRNFCSLSDSIDKSTTIENLVEKQGKDRPLILYAKSDVYEEKKYIYKGIEIFFEKNNEIATKEVISLYDSLDYLNVPKESKDGEKFFCNNCLKPQSFKKNINLYSLPIYLILQLKKGRGDKFIEYKTTLDLKDYIIGPNKKNSVYELYAVILYKRSINGSNYISYCKNFGTWISYSIDGLEVIYNPINKDAHILFYKRSDVE